MIGISKLYCGTVEASDPLRYGRASDKLPSHLLQFSADKKPIVVWNCTRRCNLRCEHCYSASDAVAGENEMTDTQARTMIDDLADFGAAALLFSGGEPLLRPGVMELVRYAVEKKLRVVISTNGTVITADLAGRFKNVGVSYVGISLDGANAKVNDRFRGLTGAFDEALAGIGHCRDAAVKVGLRFTMHSGNVDQIDGIFDLVKREKIPRVCFYHLVSTGRGKAFSQGILSSGQTRRAVGTILQRTRDLHENGHCVEVLTVGNGADGAYLYLKLLDENPGRAANVHKLLRMNGGNSSGMAIASVSWDGQVHPDQFWRNQVVGNVREQPFSEIWGLPANTLLKQLRDRKKYLQGRCLRCRFLDICNGNLRARAEAAGNGIWGDDPGCYLSDEEIAS